MYLINKYLGDLLIFLKLVSNDSSVTQIYYFNTNKDNSLTLVFDEVEL